MNKPEIFEFNNEFMKSNVECSNLQSLDLICKHMSGDLILILKHDNKSIKKIN